MSSDLIRTIKKLVLEAGIPNFGGKLGAAVKSNPPPQGGAVFGGGTSSSTPVAPINRSAQQTPLRMGSNRNIGPSSGGGISGTEQQRADPAIMYPINKGINALRTATGVKGSRVDIRSQNSSVPEKGWNPQYKDMSQPHVSKAPVRQTPGNDPTSYAAAGRGMSTLNSKNAAGRAADRASVSPKPTTTASAPATQSQNPRAPNYHNPNVAPKPQTTVAPATQKQPTTTSAPKPTSTAPKPSTSMPKPKSTVKPVDKKPISSKPIKRISKPAQRPGKWGFGGGSGSQDAGSITNRALGAVNETTKLIETIKTLTKKKNCKGESPKGTPDEVIINPESGLLPPSR